MSIRLWRVDDAYTYLFAIVIIYQLHTVIIIIRIRNRVHQSGAEYILKGNFYGPDTLCLHSLVS